MAYDIIIGRDEDDRQKFGKEGTVFLGKTYVQMGRITSLANPVYLDVARNHTILICGKRGSGKCLHGDSLVSLENGSQVPIKNLESNPANILSLNGKLKVEKSAKSEFFSREVERLVRVKLRSGKEIKLTPEHPLLTIKGWTPAEELGLGSRIATPRKSCFGENTLPEHEIKLLAYLIAEGHTKKIVLFSNKDLKIVEDFKDSLYKLDPNLRLIKEGEGHYRISFPEFKTKILNKRNLERDSNGRFVKGLKMEVEKRSIRKFIERYKLFGLLAIEKQIPSQIMELSKEGLKLFLSRLFSCDGSVYKNRSRNGWELSYSSSSKKLISQVHHLLLKFGVLSKVRKKNINLKEKKFISYEIVVNIENTLKFVKQIGFFGDKEKRVLQLIEECGEIVFNSNVDTIPKDIWKIYKPENWAEIGRFCGYKHPKAMRERIKYNTTRQVMLQISRAEENPALKVLAESDVFWDEIVSMEVLEGKFKVYDICVPEKHNFVANDIFVHNSYSSGVMCEGIIDFPEEIKDNMSVILFDTMGIFWTMKYGNKKDEALLEEWGLEAKELDIDLFVPKGSFQDYKTRGIPADYEFALQPKLLNAGDWCGVFGIEVQSDDGVLISRILKKLSGDYSINDIIYHLEEDQRSEDRVKERVQGLFISANTWGLFDEEAIELNKIAEKGKVNVIDLSCYSQVSGNWSIKSLVAGILGQKLLSERITERKKEEIENIERGYSMFGGTDTKSKLPLLWIFIDEAHNFLPKDKNTPATDALISLLREGRQPGISMVLATQQPGKVHDDVITQSDIVLCHRITAKQDVDALNAMMQSYMEKGLTQAINDLPREKGAAVILDDVSERIYPLKVRPRKSWHGGEAPSALKGKKKLELGI